MFIRQPIEYDCFKTFMDIYLEAEIPEDLSKHLFLSFLKKKTDPAPPPLLTVAGPSSAGGKSTPGSRDSKTPSHQQQGSEARVRLDSWPKDKLYGITEKLHSLTGKLQGLGGGHSARQDGGSNTGNGSDTSGRRIRTGRITLWFVIVIIFFSFVSVLFFFHYSSF